jgi:hypothetical protein
MLGKKSEAARKFKAAEKLFKLTKDPRGLAYAHMGLGELSSNRSYFLKAEKESKEFAWEHAQAKRLLKGMKTPVNWP